MDNHTHCQTQERVKNGPSYPFTHQGISAGLFGQCTQLSFRTKTSSKNAPELFNWPSFSYRWIRLFALDFYEVIIDSDFDIINYHLIEISSS